MKTKINLFGKSILVFALIVAALVIGTACASAQTLYLYAKYEEPASYGPWPINDCLNAPSGELTYSLTGPATWSFTAEKLTPGVKYALIYYADPWDGDNPSYYIAGGTALGDGILTISPITAPTMNIPISPDANNPLAGKIWLVTATDYNSGAVIAGPMTGWNPRNYLYESEGGLNYVVGTSAADVEITAGEVGVVSAGTYTLPINMSTGISTVGSIQLEVHYNKVIVSGGTISVNSISAGSGIGSSSFESHDDTVAKKVTISIIDSTGLTGSNINIADIEFNIDPATPATSILYGMSLTAEVTDNLSTPIELSSAVDNGYIWIMSPVIEDVIGDVDNDGYVTATDALEYLKKAADSTYDGDIVDICGTSDGITAWDALRVLKASTGDQPATYICP